VSLRSIRGLDPSVHEAAGRLFHWGQSGIQHFAEAGQYVFPVDVVQSVGLSQKEWLITGTVEDLNHFVSELQFVSGRRSEISALRVSGQVVAGAYEGAESMVRSTWELVSNPWDTIKSLLSAIPGAATYLWDAVRSGRNLKEDLSVFLNALWENKLEELAESRQLSCGLLQTAEARALLRKDAVARFSGQILFELATLLVAFTKISKITQASKLARLLDQVTPDALLRNAKLLPKGPRLLANRERRAQNASAIHNAFSKNFGTLIDPARVATIGEKAAKERARKVLYWMHEANRAGRGSLDDLISEALGSAKAQARNPSLRHDPEILRRQLATNYRDADRLGLFDSKSNLEALKHGRAPVVRKGPHAGQTVDVDHIVPLAHAPDLGNHLGNLRVLPASVNRSRRHTLDQDALAKISEFRQVGLWTDS